MRNILLFLFIASSTVASFNVVAMEEQAVQVCSSCYKILNNPPKCNTCKSVFYCDRNCQRADWTTHKPFCKQTAEKNRQKERVSNSSNSTSREDIHQEIANGIKDYLFFAQKHYGKKVGLKLFSTLNELGKDFPKLLVDQSLMLKLPQFVSFVSNQGGTRDPWDLHRDFMRNQQKVTVFRALYLTKEEHELILKRGLESRSLVSGILPMDSLNEKNLPQRISERMNRVGSEITRDPIISVSTAPELAHLIGEMCSWADKKVEGKMYIYKITISSGALFSHWENKSWFEPTFRERSLDNYDEYDWFVDPKIEKFLFFKIDPYEIEHIGTYEPRNDLENHVAYGQMRQQFPQLWPKGLPIAIIVLCLAGYDSGEFFEVLHDTNRALFNKDQLEMAKY
jgi:hypothetical protein